MIMIMMTITAMIVYDTTLGGGGDGGWARPFLYILVLNKFY